MRKKAKVTLPYAYVVIVILVSPLFRLSRISQRNAPLADYIRDFSNIVPLRGIMGAITKAIDAENAYYTFPLIVNFLVMVPVGLFYGYFMRQRNFKAVGFVCIRYAVLFGFLYSIRILLRMGSFDIDDILLNIGGMLFGMILASQGKQKKRTSAHN